jgi:CubicO group peptidase (beta-lactamase class C family)
VPGAGLGVLRNGSATTAYYGVADVTTGESVTAETRFSAGSLTKSMVATVIARLAQEGRLSLDDRVSDHVPELRGTTWAQRAVVRDLLANRSGLPMRNASEFGFDTHADADDGALARLAAEVSGDGPHIDFWSYTNVGWCLLGRVIETTTGASWEVAMRRYLFDTTDMSRTTFANEAGFVRRAVGHVVTPTGPVPVKRLAARAYAPAGTTVVSTVPDLLRFTAMHLQDPTLGLCETFTGRWRFTAGSMPGVLVGPDSTGRVGRSGAGMASSTASVQFCGSCPSVTPPSS